MNLMRQYGDLKWIRNRISSNGIVKGGSMKLGKWLRMMSSFAFIIMGCIGFFGCMSLPNNIFAVWIFSALWLLSTFTFCYGICAD